MKKKKGRKPSIEITPQILSEIEKLGGVGLSQKQIASYYGIHEVTFIKMKNRDERINIAYKKGKSKAITIVAGRLMEQIHQGNITAIIFYLKTQARWREKSSLTVDNNIKLKSKQTEYKIDTMDAIEASKIYQSIMTGCYKDERDSSSK